MTAIFTRQSPLGGAVKAERHSRFARAFSLSRLIEMMAVDGPLIDGYEREILEESAAANGDSFSRGIAYLPLSLLSDPTSNAGTLQRDMQLATGSAGGYLVGTETAPVLDMLRPWSVAARAGITALQADVRGSSIKIPPVTAGATGYWLSSETAAITASTPTLGLISMQRRTVGALVKFSLLLNKQSNVVDAMLQRELLGTIGTLIDKAIFNGSGAGGQPLGILNTAGIGTQSGVALGASGLLTMEQAIADANGDDSKIGFVTTPAVRKLLKTREIAAGSGAVWQSSPAGEQLIGRSASVTTDMPTATMIGGAWNNLLLAMWGSPRLEINPYDQAGFKTMTIEARLVFDVDVAVQNAGAWIAASSIT